MCELLGEPLEEESFHEGLLVEDIPDAIYYTGRCERLGREGAGSPAAKAGFVGVDLVGLFDGVHVEVAIAGFGSGGASISSTSV